MSGCFDLYYVFVCTKSKWKVKLRFKYYCSRSHKLEKSDFNHLQSCLHLEIQASFRVRTAPVPGGEWQSRSLDMLLRIAVTLNSTHFHCPSSTCRKSIFLMEQYYERCLTLLGIRERITVSANLQRQDFAAMYTNHFTTWSFGMFIEVPQMYQTRNVSIFWAHSLRTAKGLDAKLQARVKFYNLSCKPMKLEV